MAQETDVGKYGTGFYQGDVADRRLVIDMSKKIHMLSPSDTPFYVLLSQAAKETAVNPKFEWMEDENFVTRTFTCDFIVRADTNTNDTIAYLSLRNPNDVQALEAPPWLSTAADYDQTSTVLTKISVNTTGTTWTHMWVILEKAAIEAAGTWDTIDAEASAKVFGGGGTFVLDSGNPTGYLIPIGYAVGQANDYWNPTEDPFWHDDTSGVITYGDTANMTIGIDDSGLGGNGGVVPLDANANSQVTLPTAQDYGTDTEAEKIYTAKVQVFTPNLLNQGYYEGSGLPEETRKGVRLLDGYTQIFKTPYTITGTAIATSYVGGDEFARIRSKKGKQHKIDLEQACLFNGAKAIDATTSESPKRTMQGFGIGSTTKAGFIKTHHPGAAVASYDVTGTSESYYCINNTTGHFYQDLIEAMERIFYDGIEGSTTKNMFVSQKWLGAFTTWADSSSPHSGFTFNTTVAPSAATFGIRVMQYQTPFGLVNLIHAPVLRGMYEDYAVLVDFKNVTLKTLSSRDTKLIGNAQGPDEDGLKEYYLTEMGLKCMHESTHGILRLTTS